MAYSGLAQSGILLTGLAQLPNSELDPDIYSALASVYMAIHNLDTLIELRLGIIKPSTDEVKSAQYGYTGGLGTNGLNRIWVPKDGTVNVGDVVAITSPGGVTSCAQANSGAVPRGIGICTATVDATFREVTIGQGVITNVFVGLTPGTGYWLSNTVSGQLTNGAVGAIPQLIGIALDATTFYLHLMGRG